MKNEFFVNSGDVKVCQGNGMLRAGAIGSCIVVTGYDPDTHVGGMAHVMLPGGSQNPDPSVRTRYAENALQEMMRRMSDSGATEAGLSICLIGGGNLLGNGHDSPGPETAQSLVELFDTMGIRPVATELGGTQRRTCALDVACGRVTYTVGDSSERTLWESRASDPGPAEKKQVDPSLKPVRG